MLILASATDKLQIVTASPGTINVHASYLDNVAGTVVPGRKNTQVTTATTTDVVLAPAGGTYRNLKTLQVYNAGAAANTVTVQHTDGATAAQLHQVTLGAQATLQYIDEIGFLIANAPRPGSTVLISSQVVTTPVATINFATGLDATYDEYLIRILTLRPSVNDSLRMRISEDGGATWKQGVNDYVWAGMFCGFNTPNGTAGVIKNGGLDNAIAISTNITSAPPYLNNNIRLSVAFPAASGQTKEFVVDGATHDPVEGICRLCLAGMYFADANPINGIQFFLAGGNTIAGGTFNFYGIAK
jgi:hypothetical protein